MLWAFPHVLYGERQQVESVISRAKRRLGAALTARQRSTQMAEQVLRVLTHNLLLLHCARRTFQQSRCQLHLRVTLQLARSLGGIGPNARLAIPHHM